MNEENCICLKTKKIGRIDVFLIYFSLIFFPMFLIVRGAALRGIDNINYILIINIVLALMLLVLSILSVITKKSYLALFFGCHQRIDRSFTLFNKVMSICSRCFGIYCGVFLSLIIFVFFDSVWLLLLAMPLTIDGVIQLKTNYKSNNSIRFVTGLMFGVCFVYLFAQYNYYIFIILNTLIPVNHIS